MNLNVLLGDMLAAILAPIINGILGLFAALVSLMAELLPPVLAPIVEAILWVYVALIAAFSHLIWGLVRLLGLASHARGLSFVFFALAIAATLYLLAGMALFFEGDTQNVLRSGYSTHSVLVAFVGMLVAAAIGSCLRNDPSATEPNEAIAQTSDAPSVAPSHVRNRCRSYVTGAVLAVGCGLLGLRIYNSVLAANEKRTCTKTETAIIVAGRVVGSKSGAQNSFDTEDLKCRLP
ncbi:hypothetical protein P5P81_11540 [Tritonibacter mobilis]|nr:hypothetical protein [Tritonibacter mobilis]